MAVMVVMAVTPDTVSTVDKRITGMKNVRENIQAPAPAIIIINAKRKETYYVEYKNCNLVVRNFYCREFYRLCNLRTHNPGEHPYAHISGIRAAGFQMVKLRGFCPWAC